MKAHENPFRVQRILELRYRPQGESWNSLLERFDALGRRVCLLGEEGSGKTTLLEDLCPLLERRGYRPLLRLHAGEAPRPDWSELSRLGAKDILLLDGADLLPRVQWWRLRRLSHRWGGLIAASHRRRLLPVLLTCRTSAALLEMLIAQLLPEEPRQRVGELARSLHARHRGNLREALRECYDCWANMPCALSAGAQGGGFVGAAQHQSGRDEK